MLQALVSQPVVVLLMLTLWTLGEVKGGYAKVPTGSNKQRNIVDISKLFR